MRLQAEVPLVLRQEPLTVDLPQNAPISAALRGNVELATFNDLLATTGDRAQGRLDVNLNAGGSLANPQLGGNANIANGRYENQAAGTVISEIVMRLRGDGKRLTIDQFAGRTPDGGAVEASGSVNVDPTDPQAFDIRVGASNAQLVQIDLVTAKIDTLLSLTGPLDNPLLQGPITIERADIRIPEQMPPSVVEIQVKEINRRGGAPTPAEEPARRDSPFQLRLDLTVKAQNQIFVRGRGLEIEMSSDVTVGGTAAKPILGGGLKLVNGTLDLLTKRFEFTQANVDFVGDGSTDPVLDVNAQAKADRHHGPGRGHRPGLRAQGHADLHARTAPGRNHRPRPVQQAVQRAERDRGDPARPVHRPACRSSAAVPACSTACATSWASTGWNC